MNRFRRRILTKRHSWQAQSATVIALVVALLGSGCAADGPRSSAQPPLEATPGERAVRLETSGCGLASGRTGSGVVIEGGVIVTVAHLVLQADTVTATIGVSGPVVATVTAVDRKRDLALLRIATTGFDQVAVAGISGEPTGTGLVVGGAKSGTVPIEIRRPARISIEEVLGEERHERLGYELDASTATGDSGAGVYDAQDRLIGIVFATSDEESTTWATATSEILSFFNENQSLINPLVCDQALSRLSGV